MFAAFDALLSKHRYIFNADFPAEQLFNLTADPLEQNDLSAVPEYEVCMLLYDV